MAEHFRASEGTGPAEPNGPDQSLPTPGAPAPDANAPVPGSPSSYQPIPEPPAVAPVPVTPADGVPTVDPAPLNPQVPPVTPPFLQTPGQSQAQPQAQPQQAPPQVQPVPSTQPVPAPQQIPVPRRAPHVQASAPQASVPQMAPVSVQTAHQGAAQDPGYEPHGLYASLGENQEQPKVNRSLEPTISMRHVTKIYPAQPNKPALEDVSLDIYPGEFVFIVGHSGSGKSTFLRLLTRELRVTSGDIMVAGQSLAKMRNWKVPFLRRQIGCVFQDFKLLQDRTTYENVAFSLECIGKPKSVIKAQVPEVLRLVGLADKMDMFPDQLSGGEQQRVSVARAMVNRPPLLICDEPTGNLDPAISLGIMKLLDAINRNGTTVIMATHDREMVDSMRKRVVALENGHLVRDQERGGYGFYGSL